MISSCGNAAIGAAVVARAARRRLRVFIPTWADETIAPLRLYFNKRGYAKIELGVCRGKKLHDKRESVKERDAKREIARDLRR